LNASLTDKQICIDEVGVASSARHLCAQCDAGVADVRVHLESIHLRTSLGSIEHERRRPLKAPAGQ